MADSRTLLQRKHNYGAKMYYGEHYVLVENHWALHTRANNPPLLRKKLGTPMHLHSYQKTAPSNARVPLSLLPPPR